jgi:membrane protein DedA with SNARE-associated domain/membrane-associated phospholipid phosphatase
MRFLDRILDIPPGILNPWVYWFILLVSLLEPIPVLGAIMPGQTLILLSGFLAKQGILDFKNLVAFATAGSVLGDLASYLIGKRYGGAFLGKYGKYFLMKKERLEKVEAHLRQHTGKTLILGRFSSVTRCFAPFLSGSMGLPFAKFMIFNVVGGFGWSLGLVAAGFFFGKSVEVGSRYIGQSIFIGLLLSGIILLLVKWRNKGKRVFSRKHRYILIMNILSLYLCSKIIEDVLDGTMDSRWDLWIHREIGSMANPALDAVMGFFARALSPLHLCAAAVPIFLFLILKWHRYKAWFLITGLGGGLLIDFALQTLVRRPGPGIGPMAAQGFSFPSAQATTATLFFCLMIFLFKEDIRKAAQRVLFIAGNIALMLLSGFSLVYLNIHWFSDVLGGISLGLFWLTLLILIYKNFIPRFRDEEADAKMTDRPAAPLTA